MSVIDSEAVALCERHRRRGVGRKHGRPGKGPGRAAAESCRLADRHRYRTGLLGGPMRLLGCDVSVQCAGARFSGPVRLGSGSTRRRPEPVQRGKTGIDWEM